MSRFSRYFFGAPSLATRRRIHGGGAAHRVSGHASSLVSRGLGPPPPPMAARRAGGSRRPARRAPEAGGGEVQERTGRGPGHAPACPCRGPARLELRPPTVVLAPEQAGRPWLRLLARGTCASSISTASAASPGSGWRRLSSRPLLPCRAATLLSTAPPSLPRGAMATTSPRQLAAELQRPAACGGAAGAPRGMRRRGGERPARIQAPPAGSRRRRRPCSPAPPCTGGGELE